MSTGGGEDVSSKAPFDLELLCVAQGRAPPPLRRPERVNYIACGALVAMTIRHVEEASNAGCVRSLVAACGRLKRQSPLAPIDEVATE